MENYTICTIASLNYFAQVKCLAQSLKRFCKGIDFYVLIADDVKDESVKEKIESCANITKVFYVNDIGIENIVELEFKYNLVEFNTAIKPFFIEFLLNKFNKSSVYIDPDIMLFNTLDDMNEKLEEYSIILTPHVLKDDRNDNSITDFLSYGVFNLGFIAVKNDKNGRELLSWWKSKLLDYCYLDLKHSLAWDQKWLDFAPALFDAVYIMKNPGYNFAYWNMNERVVTKTDDTYYINSEFKLVFTHSSHYKPTFKREIAHIRDFKLRYKLTETAALREIFDYYYNTVMKNGFEYFSMFTYGFNSYDNGKKIEPMHRKLFNCVKNMCPDYKNPFDTTGEKSFYNFTKSVDYYDFLLKYRPYINTHA